jgi:hypothetical protein
MNLNDGLKVSCVATAIHDILVMALRDNADSATADVGESLAVIQHDDGDKLLLAWHGASPCPFSLFA